MKKDLRVVKTLKSIRRALMELLMEKPLDRIPVSELCRKAEINRGTFYLHYKDVNGVFQDYLDEILADLKTSYNEPYYRTNFHIEKLEADMIQIFHHVKKYQNFYEIVFHERISIRYYYTFFDTVRSFMKESLEISGETSAMEEREADFLLSFMTNAILGLIIEWHRENYETPVPELNRHLIDILQYQKMF